MYTQDEQSKQSTSLIDPRDIVIPSRKRTPQTMGVSQAGSLEPEIVSKECDFSHVTNAEFIAAVFPQLPEGAFAAVCSKAGDPTEGGWFARKVDSNITELSASNNNYISCSSFYPGNEGIFNVRKPQFAACHFLMLDDLGTKVPLEKLGDFELSWLIETSPNNFQGGIILTSPITEGNVAEELLKSLIAAELCDAGASGPLTRWARLPNAINGKPKHNDINGASFCCRLIQWHAEKRYTEQEIVEGLKLELRQKNEPKTAIERQHNLGFDKQIDQEANDTSIQKIEALLNRIDADCGYDDWLHVGMAVFHETSGSDEGLALFDRWSSKGSKYKGIKEIEYKWRSFRFDESTPVTIGTLIKMARDAGADGFEPCGYEVISNTNETSSNSVDIGNPLAKYFLNNVDELEEKAVEQVPILGNIVLLGQSTAIFAKPNTGKTLLSLYLIVQGIKAGMFDPAKLIYINMDDDSNGLVVKARLAEEYGFKMIADGHKGFEANVFREAVMNMTTTDSARNVIIVLDTLKRFVDTMNKGKSACFTKFIRQFTLTGGTVIALAHTNKKPGSDGKPVYSGTADIVDDFDCAYTLFSISEQTDANQKVVEFTNIKRRGNVALSASYSYSQESNISYYERLLSVQEVDPEQLVPIKHVTEYKSDTEMITAISNCITDGINTKMKLAEESARHAKVSKRTALRIIEKYTGDDPTIHQWSFVVRERGAKVFKLLERPTEHPPAPAITTP
ncbi:PriCT-2 domain-containing protein [Pelobacter propionicus]|uniref:Primase C-terminal 2 domain-containing protein n=1 Tax=Pelobacter propionicus (strain DSM 2379 / NBRC 103807 / OttBd1) TaxID=338966 RepID=A1AUY5_PELPD|nr:PriCT-2 domain-containing protein [Pelobacter propionicus]ABL01156.1 hypothetical protein Ppro_3564 [Pelobacter propionicus DSM 2379]